MKVSQFEPFIGTEEYEAIRDCFEKKWITEGPKSKQFNEELLKIVGAKYGVFAPNGTLALYLALRSIGIGPGDEVIVPDFTFIASANAVEMTGATPVFADIDLQDLHIKIDSCKELLTPRTKAIMPVHIYGMSANMTEVMQFANENNLLVIEDAAQALGVKWDGKSCGSFGDVACFSFFADKTVTTAEGGFITTNNEEVYKNLQFLRNQGRLHRGTFIHPEIGYNFRLTDIQAAVGLAQLKKLDRIIKLKEKVFRHYLDRLDALPGIRIVKPRKEVSPFIPFRVAVMTDNNSDELMSFMNKHEIETRTFFYPLHRQPCFGQSRRNTNSVLAYDRGVCLPSYPSLSEEKIDFVCDIVERKLLS